MNEALRIFGLSEEYDKEHEFEEKEMFSVPKELGKERR